MKSLLILVCAVVAAAGPARAQRLERPVPREEERTQAFLVYDALFAPAADTAGSILVPYAIDLDFFVAARSRTAPGDRPFARKGEILIELFDSTGTSAARDIQPVEAFTATSERIQVGRSWYQGIASLTVPPGTYRVLAELTDLQSRRTFSERYRSVRSLRWRAGELALSTPFFVKGAAGEAPRDTLRLQNTGSDFLFGQPGSLAFLISGADTQDVRLGYVLSIDDREGGKEVRRDSLSRLVVRRGATLAAGNDSSGVYAALVPAKNSTLVMLPLPLAMLPLRNYALALHVRRGQETQASSSRFRAFWPEMPLSLKDVDLAIDALRLLAPEAVVERMKREDFEKRRDKLEEFWNAKDSTRPTAYNPLEAEYYRRVDHAIRSFGTLHQVDGSRTDRGKIYILFGPPTTNERMLNPSGAFREVWTYAKTGKTFVFEDQSRTGNYVLITSGGS